MQIDSGCAGVFLSLYEHVSPFRLWKTKIADTKMLYPTQVDASFTWLLLEMSTAVLKNLCVDNKHVAQPA